MMVKQRGQSLVEFSLTLPMLLLIIIATVEVSNILLAANEMQLYSREGARQASRGLENTVIEDIILVSLKDIETGEIPERLDTDHLNIWIVRPIAAYNGTTYYWENGATDGSDWGDATLYCMYGDDCDSDYLPIGGATPNTSPQTVAASLTRTAETLDPGGLAGEDFTIVILDYEVELILDIPIFDPGDAQGRFPIETFTIIRQEAVPPSEAAGGPGSDTGGGSYGASCAAFPIIFQKPDPEPATGTVLTFSSLGYPQSPATVNTADFALLSWHPDYDTISEYGQTLSSVFYSVNNPAFLDPVSLGDQLVIGANVRAYTGSVGDIGSSSSYTDILDDHIDTISNVSGTQSRTLLVPMFDDGTPTIYDPDGGGPQPEMMIFPISEFALVQIVSDSGSGAGYQMTVRFLQFWTECGQ